MIGSLLRERAAEPWWDKLQKPYFMATVCISSKPEIIFHSDSRCPSTQFHIVFPAYALDLIVKPLRFNLPTVAHTLAKLSLP